MISMPGDPTKNHKGTGKICDRIKQISVWIYTAGKVLTAQGHAGQKPKAMRNHRKDTVPFLLDDCVAIRTTQIKIAARPKAFTREKVLHSPKKSSPITRGPIIPILFMAVVRPTGPMVRQFVISTKKPTE